MSVSLCLVMLVGITACVIILAVGIVSIQQSKEVQFERNVEDFMLSFDKITRGYLLMGLWTHEACLHAIQSSTPRTSFRRFWEDYIQRVDLKFTTLGCAINVTHDDREQYENETRTYLSENGLMQAPNGTSLYKGFNGYEMNRITGERIYCSTK